MDPKEMIEKLNKAFEEFKKANDERIGQLASKGSVDTLVEQKVNALNGEISKLSTQLKDVEKLAARPAPAANADPLAEVKLEHKNAFGNMMRKGDVGTLRELEKKSMSSFSDPDGGFLVPEEINLAVTRIQQNYGAIRSLAQVTQIGGNSYKKFVSKGGAVASWVAESGTINATATPTLAQLEFAPGKMVAYPVTTQEILDDAGIDLAAWLADEVGVTFGETEGAAFVSGDGVNKPRGILSYTMVANSSYAWGKIGFVKTGAAAGFDTGDGKFPLDALIDLTYALKRGYRQNATFLMNDLTQGQVRKFKDQNGQYLWQPPAQVGQPALLLGKPVETDDFMPDIGADQFPVAFGDFRRGYQIVDRAGVAVIRDNVTMPGFVKFLTTKRTGGGVQNFEAIKVLKCST